jgi:ribosome-binding factor A
MRPRGPVPEPGPGQRRLRVGELIRRAIADVLARGEVSEPLLGQIPITVGEVRVSPDLKHATAFVLPLGGVNTAEVLAALDRCRPEIRHRVARAVNLRHAPDIRFEADTTYDRLDETRRLFADSTVRRDLEGKT